MDGSLPRGKLYPMIRPYDRDGAHVPGKTEGPMRPTIPAFLAMVLLADVCSSLRVHGFRHIVLIGDHGPDQDGLQQVAADLSKTWAGGRTQVHYIAEYYDDDVLAPWLEKQGLKQADEGLHDDFIMEAQMMVVDPSTVRMKQRIAAGRFRINGVDLAPAEKTIEWGRKIVEYRASLTVAAIRKAIGN